MTGQIQVSVEDEVYNAGVALAQFVADVKAALVKGGTVNEAIAIGSSALNNLVPQLSNVAAIQADVLTDPADSITTALLVGQKIYIAIKS